MRKILSAFAALLAITACYNGNQQKAETAATTDGKAIVENIMTRTSIRQYTDQAISADTIETLLGAVWTALYPRNDRAKGAIEALKLPEYIVPLCAIIIGHPAEQPTPKDKWKPENVSYNEFGGKIE